MSYGKPQLLKDITPGAASTNIGSTTGFKNNLYFAVNNTNNTFDIWKSDGTGTGTKLLKSTGEFSPDFLSYLETPQLYFTGVKNDGNYDTPNPVQLWKTDGTAKGTNLVKDIGKWDDYFSYGNVDELNGKIFFTSAKYDTKTKTNNYELWQTDGTSKGTKLVKSFGQNDIYLSVSDDKNKNLYFTIRQDDDGDILTPNTYQLWKTNGTAKGTTLVKDVGKWDYGNSVNEWNDKIYFTSAKYDTKTKTNNYELWQTDGTSTGTKLVKSFGKDDISLYGPADETNKYFTTVKDDGDWETPDPYQLWKTDGTAKGTSLIKDVGKWDYGNSVDEWNGKIYFTSAKYDTKTKTNNYELWSTDGTTTGTKLVKNFGLNQPDYLYSEFEGKNLYFTTVKDDGNYETPDPYQLWKTDGTAKGTTLIKDVGKWDYGNSVDEWNGKIYFTSAKYDTKTKTNNYELWSTDGTSTGTKLVKSFGKDDIRLYGPSDETNKYFTTVKDDGDWETPDPYQLWKTDGTPKGTKLVQDLGKTPGYVNNYLDSGYYYEANTKANGNELWKLPFTPPATTGRSATETDTKRNYDPLLQGGLGKAIIDAADNSGIVLPPDLQTGNLRNLLQASMNGNSNEMALDELRTKLSQVQELLPLNVQDSIF